MIKGEIFMLRRIIIVCSLYLLITGFLLPAAMPVYAGSPTKGKQQHVRADFPTVDPSYI